MTLTLELKRIRKELGLTQKDLSKLTGLDEAVISRIETGKANPTLKMLERIAKPLKLKIELTDI